MDINKLARVADSASGGKQPKIKDSGVRRAKALLRKRLMDTESTEEAVEVVKEQLTSVEPELALQAVTEVLADVIDDLEQEVTDAKEKLSKVKQPRTMDEDYKKVLRAKLMDSDSSEEIIEIAKEAMAEVDPTTVLETVIEVIDEVTEGLPGSDDEPPTE